jgi:hypothetical protein
MTTSVKVPPVSTEIRNAIIRNAVSACAVVSRLL